MIMPSESDPGIPDHSEVEARQQDLFELITLCLWHADAMGLAMTAIHLNDALESLKRTRPEASG